MSGLRDIFKVLRRAFYGIVIGSTFIYGVGVGHYQLPPFQLLYELKDRLHPSASSDSPATPTGNAEHAPSQPYQGERELLQFAFVAPTISGQLLKDAITNLSGIRSANESILVRIEGFESAYKAIEHVGVRHHTLDAGATSIIEIQFRFQGRTHSAYAYGPGPGACNRSEGASLIVPGSGDNQSSAIAKADPQNYQFGILDALGEGNPGRIYKLIKPNEDALAWHDGNSKKLGGAFIWNWHLNRGGSYSASYLVQGMALAKWMKDCFSRTALAGLSQGGTAAFLIGLQGEFDRVVVASGYSILNREAEWSDPNQIAGVPAYGDLNEPSNLAARLSASPSRWLFSWGMEESGAYLMEAHERVTAAFIEHLPNVEIEIHKSGHAYPFDRIIRFLKSDQ